MRSDLIVECQVPRHRLLGLADGVVSVEIDFFIFETSPQPFHEHVVAPTPGSIQADLNVMSFQEPRKLLARKLTALISIEDL